MTAIDWAKLQHAYGAAGDIPSLLDAARLAKAGNSYRDEPWFSLWSSLCHQGDVYTASYAAVPELVAIAHARIGNHAAARECVLLAGMIELERAMPEGRLPPPLPVAMQARYIEAMSDGARIGQSLRDTESDPDYARGLEIAVAALSGNAVEARRLDHIERDG